MTLAALVSRALQAGSGKRAACGSQGGAFFLRGAQLTQEHPAPRKQNATHSLRRPPPLRARARAPARAALQPRPRVHHQQHRRRHRRRPRHYRRFFFYRGCYWRKSPCVSAYHWVSERPARWGDAALNSPREGVGAAQSAVPFGRAHRGWAPCSSPPPAQGATAYPVLRSHVFLSASSATQVPGYLSIGFRHAPTTTAGGCRMSARFVSHSSARIFVICQLLVSNIYFVSHSSAYLSALYYIFLPGEEAVGSVRLVAAGIKE